MTSTATGKTTPEAVSAVEVNHDTDLYDLSVKTSQGVEVIHTTAAHLFWDPAARAWVEAASLKPGEPLKAAGGQTVTADGGTTPATASGWMWDLTIPGNNDHDFYVLPGGSLQPRTGARGYSAGAVGIPVLVHNSGLSCGLGPLKGSGPVPGVIEVSGRAKSVAAFVNYTPKGGGIE